MADKKPATAQSAKKPTTPNTSVSQQQQSSLRNFLILMIGGTVVIALLGGYLGYKFVNQNITKAREITAQSAYITMAEQRLDKAPAAEEALKKIKEANGDKPSNFDLVTKRALPVTPDFSTNITILSELEKQTGIELSSITNGFKEGASTAAGVAPVAPVATADSTATPGTVSSSQSYPLTLKISGKYSQIINFINRIEQSVRVFDFSNMKISGTADSLTLDMTYKAYYTKEVKLETQVVPLEDYLDQVKNDLEYYN